MVISKILRDALTARIPGAGFAPYFAFIESLPQASTGHKHHILPKKTFPEFAKEASNIVRLSPADHFRAHYRLALCARDYAPFQTMFYFMTKMKHAYQISEKELPQYIEMYELGRAKQAEVARVNAHIQGRKNVQSGFLAKQLASIRTHAHQVKAGHAAGQKAMRTGQIESLKCWGKVAATSGQLAKASTFESRAKGRHNRWHVNRGIVNPNCKLCAA